MTRPRFDRIPWGTPALEFGVVTMGVLAAPWAEEWREEADRRERTAGVQEDVLERRAVPGYGTVSVSDPPG